MAIWDPDNDFDYGSLPEAQQQQVIFESIFGEYHDLEHDAHAKDLFWDVMYNDDLTRYERDEKFEELKEWYLDEYGIQFDDLWDWEDFRAWYDD